MSRHGGFTLVELLITIIVMVILMTLAVTNIRSSQVGARDKERQSDVENMVRHLDSLYTKGTTFTYSGSPVTLKGAYPSVSHMTTASVRNTLFVELSPSIQVDPSKSTSTESIFAATSNKTGTDRAVTATAVTPFPSASSPYIYQALKTDGTLCTANQACTRFRFYYFQEKTPTIAGVVKSGYQ